MFVEELLGCTFPRVGLLLSGIALLGAAAHHLVASAMPPSVGIAFLTGAAPLAWPGRVERGLGKWSITKSVMKLVTDEALHPIGKIQLLLIGLNLPQRVECSRTGARLPGLVRPQAC